MAAFAYTDAYLEVNSVDLSSYVRSCQLTENGVPVDVSAMGTTADTLVGSTTNGTLDIEFNQDYAASAVDQTLNGLLNTITTFVFRPTSAAVSATNPQRSGSCHVSTLVHGGARGDAATMSVSWPTSGTITRSTS